MTYLDLSNIDIQKALISGIFSIINTLIAALTAGLIGKTIANRRKLQEKLDQAINDIEFLLEVEKVHCENNRKELGESRKNKVRKIVRDSDLSFSGKFTPGRVRNDNNFS
ncbi:MAG: hypothetical protein AB4057_16960 [Crocosphaera sp.]